MSSSEKVLLAEADPQYVFVLMLALKEAGFTGEPRVVTSGSELVGYLKGEGPFANRRRYPLPEVLVMGLRLVREEDFEPLQWIRAQQELDPIHVVVLSGVEFPEQEQRARALGAECYHGKPAGFQGLVRIARRIRERWLAEPGQQAAAA